MTVTGTVLTVVRLEAGKELPLKRTPSSAAVVARAEKEPVGLQDGHIEEAKVEA
jgi:hypothetical protein